MANNVHKAQSASTRPRVETVRPLRPRKSNPAAARARSAVSDEIAGANAQQAIAESWSWDDVGPNRGGRHTVTVAPGAVDTTLARYQWFDPIPGHTNTAATRLTRLRIAKGWKFASDAARAMEMNPTTYMQHENGTRAISRIAADTYAAFFGASAALILYGEAKPARARNVPVVGAITEGGIVVERMSATEPLPQSLPAPPFALGDFHALIVTSCDLAPAYQPGDVVYFGVPGARIDRALVHKRECVVETQAGAWLLCVCHANPDGTWTLATHAGLPRTGIRLRSASPVLWVQKNAMRAA